MVSIAGKIFETALVISSGKSISIQGNPQFFYQTFRFALCDSLQPPPAARGENDGFQARFFSSVN
jgi:hypothetical protein